MSKYVVVELTETGVPGIAVVSAGGNIYKYASFLSLDQIVSTHETLQEARAVAETIAAFKNLTIRTWSL